MRLPSFRALYAFTLVVKLESTNKVAKKMGVSASAVSHLIRNLEKTLDCQLIIRERGQFGLTAEGYRLSAGLREPFANIESVLEQFQPAGRWELRVTAFPTIASQWLIPKLGALCDQEPNIDILLSTTSRSVDLVKEPYDFAIRWGTGDWSALEATKLWDESLACLMAPTLLKKLQDKTIPSLGKLPRLHVAAFRDHWKKWLSGAKGVDVDIDENADSEVIIETRSFVIQAAVAGLGVAVIDPRLAHRELAEGLLVEPFSHRSTLPSSIWLVRHRDKPIPRHAKIFFDWILAEAGECQPAGINTHSS